MGPTAESRMQLIPALQVLVGLRGERIVVTTMGSAREWPKLSRHPLDFHYVPSSMGQAPALGLGLALAKPAREVLVVNGDGAMLMNLGCLVTLVASGARNIAVVVIDNGVYEVTGGQQTASTVARRHAQVDFAELARAAGFASVFSFRRLDDWQRGAAEALGSSGPRFIALAVEPFEGDTHLEAPGPMSERIEQFRQALAKV